MAAQFLLYEAYYRTSVVIAYVNKYIIASVKSLTPIDIAIGIKIKTCKYFHNKNLYMQISYD